jgi:hypothetical protein
MTTPLRFSQLSLPRQTLIRIMQSVNYGAILNLTVVNGRRVSTTLRHSGLEFSEYFRLSFVVC